MSRQKTRFLKYKPNGIKDATWRIVLEAWENGLSDREAAFRASKSSDADDIEADTIRLWCKNNPEIAELRANLQSDLLSSAKITVADALKEGDVKTAKWYLERKAADEFSTKQAVALENAVVTLSLEEKEKALQELVDNFDNGE